MEKEILNLEILLIMMILDMVVVGRERRDVACAGLVPLPPAHHGISQVIGVI